MSLSVYPHDSRTKLPVPLPNPPANQPPHRLPGDGDPACLKCHGRGTVRRVYTPEQLRALPPWEIPSTHGNACECTRARREREALDRVWKGLGTVEPVRTSPLSEVAKDRRASLWIRATSSTLLLAHLAKVLRDDPETRRSTGIVSDADLVDAETADWGQAREDHPREDGERVERSTDGRKAVDLYLPPGLLVLVLGQSSKKHSYLAMLSEEAVRRRSSRGRPTWVVDEVERPLAPGHRTYSEDLHQLLAHLPRVLLEGDTVRKVQEWPQVPRGTRTPETATVKAGDPEVNGDELDQALVAAGRPAGLPRHPAGGGAVDCDDCGGELARSIFLGRKGDLLEKCHAEGCPSKGKVSPLAKRAAPAAKAAPAKDTQEEVETASQVGTHLGPQVLKAAAWLRAQLASARPWAQIEADGRDEGYSRATLYRARKLLPIEATGPVGERVTALPAQVLAAAPISGVQAAREIDDLIDSLKG